MPQYNFKDLTGQRFGRLLVIKRAEDNVSPCGTKQVRWECQCDCGNVVIVHGQSLRTKNTQSCGCYQVDRVRETFMKHGEKAYRRETRLYNIWKCMKARCDNPNLHTYQNYGAKGVTYDAAWDEFVTFRDWAMNNGYNDALTLDRIDTRGNYEPNNCRWVNYIVQENNKTNNHTLQISDEEHTLAKWERIMNLPVGIISRRLRDGWGKEDAVMKPLQKRFVKKEDKVTEC